MAGNTMMYEIDSGNFYKVLPILSDIEYDKVYASAVAECRQRGRIFVDDTKNPTSALIRHSCGAGLLCGEYSEETVAFAANLLLNKNTVGISKLRLSVYPYILEDKLIDKLGDRVAHEVKNISPDHVKRYSRIKFKFDSDSYKKMKVRSLPEGVEIKQIDETLFDRIKGQVVPTYYWTNPVDFIKNGIGYCVVNGDTFISTSFAAYISGSEVDIGIETNPSYRMQGFAKVAAAKMIDYCLRLGLEPIWGCRSDNENSFNLAKSLGFRDVLSHNIYWSID
jgi:hypothetical protein